MADPEGESQESGLSPSHTPHPHILFLKSSLIQLLSQWGCLLFIIYFTGVLHQLNESRSQLEELWAARKMKLDLCLQLRIFERDALEVCHSLIEVSHKSHWRVRLSS